MFSSGDFTFHSEIRRPLIENEDGGGGIGGLRREVAIV